jgi:arginine decarboxylase
MILHIASAIGRAATELAAFDQALIGVGAADFNLVRLSSVIPPGSTVVEHEGESECQVRNDITASLQDLQNNRGVDFGPIRMHVIGAECQTEPLCALVLCAYRSEPWPTT